MSSPPPCRFAWYELMAPDRPAALEFYCKVFGWTTKDSGMPGGTYTLIQVQGREIGGALTLDAEMRAAGARPGWLGYIAVPDLAAKLAELQSAGGTLIRPAFTIPGVIEFAVVADPHGAVFVLFRGLAEGEVLPTFAPNTPGAVDWHELHAGSEHEAWAFYSRLFGWTSVETMDMGALGVYRMWAAGGPPIGGMMTKMPQSPAPYWQFYVSVESTGAGIERAKAAGATLLHGPEQVPGGSWIANMVDPQGGVFAMVSPNA